jgi:hypothetical protein
VDLVEANTHWELETKRATSERVADGGWRVTLDVQARKVVVETASRETEVPMNDLVEVGVYAAARDGEAGTPLYLRMHRIRSGRQRITVTVPREPARAAIDPRLLLIDDDTDDNVADVVRAAGARGMPLRRPQRSKPPVDRQSTAREDHEPWLATVSRLENANVGPRSMVH